MDRPLTSPESGNLRVRLPSVRAALIIYAALILIANIPTITTTNFFIEHQWFGLPFSLATVMLPAAAFLAVFVVNNKFAWLVTFTGVLASALISEYLRRVPDEFRAQFEESAFQVRLREVLWDAIRDPIVEYAALTGLALLAARYWTHRTTPADGPGQVELPPRRQVIAVVSALLIGYMVSDHLTSSNLVRGYLPGTIVTVVQLAAQAGFFVLAIVFFSGWVALFPLAIGVNTVALFATSSIADWDDFGWTTIKWTFILLALEFVVFMAAAWWSRGGEGSAEPDSAPLESLAPA